MTKLNDATPDEWSNLLNTMARPSAKDSQVGGNHYTEMKVQPLQLVLDTEGFDAFQGACLTKVYKYCMRNKGDRLEDFKKARHVLDMLIQEAEGRQ